MDKIRILIADDIKETRDVIKKILSLEKEDIEVVGEAGNGEEVLRLVHKVKPDIVLMDINMPVLNGLETTERLSLEYPSATVIIMSVQAESEYLKKAMFHGAKEYIIKPFNYGTLTETIKTTYDKYKNINADFSETLKKRREAGIEVFFSSKGGVGKSILAFNTAVLLSETSDKKILLFDMDLQFGDISMLANKCTQKTILDAVEEDEADSYDSLKSYIYKYNASLDMIFAPKKPEASEYVSKGNIENIIKAVKNEYDLIIVDTGINFSDSTLYVLDAANKIFMVSTMEITSLKDTKLGLKVMESLGYDSDKVRLVINKFNENYGFSKKEVEKAFKDGIIAFVPDEEKSITISVNKGLPLCSDKKYHKSKIGKAFKLICDDMNN